MFADGRAKQPALIYDSPVTGSQRTYTYGELLDETAQFAGVLRGLGVGKGDRVVVYMPMIPEAVITMLACARIGAVHSVVFGGFAPHELAARIDDARPTVVVSASSGIEPSAHCGIQADARHRDRRRGASTAAVRHRPAVDRLRCGLGAGRDLDWQELMAGAVPAGPVPVAATDPLYVLYTSGTTGKPKGVVRDNGGHAVALLWSMRHIYDVGPGRRVLGRLRRGLGRRPLLHRLRAAVGGSDDGVKEGKPVGTPIRVRSGG